MAASYPNNLKTYTDKTNGIDVVDASHINSVQSEIQAIEATIGTNPDTSLLGNASIGTYNPSPGNMTSLSARVKNIEAGLSASSSDGSRVGYTQLDQKTLTATGSGGSVTFGSTSTPSSYIPSTYQKLVIQVDFTSITNGALVSCTLNNITTGATYLYARQEYTNATTTYANVAAAKTAFELGTLSSAYNQYVIEIPNYARSTAGKVVTVLAGSLSLTGFQTTAAAVTRVDVILANLGNATATVTLYGVK